MQTFPPPAASAQSTNSGQAAAPATSNVAPSQPGTAVHTPTGAPGVLFPVDPATASLMMNPHAAAAMVAAAVQHGASQQVAQAQAATIASSQNVVTSQPQTVASAPAHSMGTVMAALLNGMGGHANAGSHHPSIPTQPAVQYHVAAAQPQTSTPSMVAPPSQSLPNNPAAVAAAAAQVVAAHNPAQTGPMTSAFMSNIKTWKLGQLESQVQLLREANQPIPQPLAMYLAEARRKEEKKTAKRVANRKSACTSRARKKALVEEMTRTNARLRRQAMILALLPDLVIAITVDGQITFCSAQVERVLRHKEQDLVGANILDILVPASKEALQHLVEELVAAERAAASADNVVAARGRTGAEAIEANTKMVRAISASGNASGQSSSASGGDVSSAGAAVVSDQSFPMSVVKVQNQQQDASSGGDSDLSTRSNGGKPVAPVSSITNNSISRSTTNSSFGIQSDEAVVPLTASGAASAGETHIEKSHAPVAGKNTPHQAQTSSDDSLSSSSDSKNLRKANEALSQNVRWHNEKLLGKSKTGSSKCAHKDDVTGASVTANNADARLSSLQHHPHGRSSPKKSVRYESLEEQSSACSSDSLLAGVEEKKKRSNKDSIENASEDSGYRESNDSQSSPESTSDSSNDKARPKPLAPTCNVCLIRDNLTTVWCEVTSSIRTRSIKESVDSQAFSGQSPPSAAMAASSAENSKESKTFQQSSADPGSSGDVVKELLLCLRPIRDGEEMVDESLRFVPASRQEASTMMDVDQSNQNSSSGGNSTSNGSDQNTPAKSRPPKKRRIVDQRECTKVSSDSSANGAKKSRLSDDTEKSVVESLILMSNNSTNA